MKLPQQILVSYVHDYLTVDKNGKHLVQLAGMSDNKPMKYQVWEMPFNSAEAARKQLDGYKELLAESKSNNFIIFLMKK